MDGVGELLLRGVQTSLAVVAVAGMPAAALPGCTQALGIEPLPSGVPFDYAEPGCAACVAESCQAEEDACRADADCQPLHECLARCPADDWDCRGRCELGQAQVLGSPVVVALDSCKRSACLDSCLGTRTRVGSAHGSGCEACLEQNCAQANRDCLAEAPCERALRCLSDCSDPECALKCIYSYGWVPSDVFRAYQSCLVSCPATCPFGELWDCVGNFAWAKPERRYVDITVRHTPRDFLGNVVPGLTVQACAPVPPPCQPIDTAVTDEQGGADLQVNTDILGFEGYFVVSGQLPGGSVCPNTLTFGRPLVRSEPRLESRYFTQAELELGAAAQGITLLDDRGHLGISIFDCSALWARNVQFEVETSDPDADPPPTYYYPSGTATDDTGSAIVANVPPGPVSITALHDGEPVAHFTGFVPVQTSAAVAFWPDSM